MPALDPHGGRAGHLILGRQALASTGRTAGLALHDQAGTLQPADGPLDPATGEADLLADLPLPHADHKALRVSRCEAEEVEPDQQRVTTKDSTEPAPERPHE